MSERLSILVVLMGALGDVVRGLAIVRQIRRAAPDCRITWLVEPKCKAMVELEPGIDRVVVFDRDQPLTGILALRRELRKERYDVALDMQRHLKSGFFAWLSGARRRIGFHRENAKELNWLFSTERLGREDEEFPKLLHYLRFVERLGFSTEPSARCGFAERDLGAPPTPLADRKPYVLLVLGSSWESKDWPPQGYHQLSASLASSGALRVVLAGDRSRTALGEEIVAALPGLDIVNLAGRTSIAELVAVIRGARACAGPDSGPGHIAAAVGVPYVALFGPTPPERVAPFGNESLVIRSRIGCSPCMRRTCPGLDRLCMRLISVDSVLEKLREAMSSPSHAARHR